MALFTISILWVVAALLGLLVAVGVIEFLWAPYRRRRETEEQRRRLDLLSTEDLRRRLADCEYFDSFGGRMRQTDVARELLGRIETADYTRLLADLDGFVGRLADTEIRLGWSARPLIFDYLGELQDVLRVLARRTR